MVSGCEVALFFLPVGMMEGLMVISCSARASSFSWLLADLFGVGFGCAEQVAVRYQPIADSSELVFLSLAVS